MVCMAIPSLSTCHSTVDQLYHNTNVFGVKKDQNFFLKRTKKSWLYSTHSFSSMLSHKPQGGIEDINIEQSTEISMKSTF